jgi:hypothetical protein
VRVGLSPVRDTSSPNVIALSTAAHRGSLLKYEKTSWSSSNVAAMRSAHDPSVERW